WSWVAVAALFVIFSGIGIRRLLVHQHAQLEVPEQKPANVIPVSPSSHREMNASAGFSGSPVLPGVSAHSATVGTPPRAKKPSQGHDRVSAMAHDLSPLENTPSSPANLSQSTASQQIASTTNRGKRSATSDDRSALAARLHDATAAAIAPGKISP